MIAAVRRDELCQIENVIEHFPRMRSQGCRSRLDRRVPFNGRESEHGQRQIPYRVVVVHRQLHVFERLVCHHLLGGLQEFEGDAILEQRVEARVVVKPVESQRPLHVIGVGARADLFRRVRASQLFDGAPRSRLVAR